MSTAMAPIPISTQAETATNGTAAPRRRVRLNAFRVCNMVDAPLPSPSAETARLTRTPRPRRKTLAFRARRLRPAY
ncbi:MAG: hypothetical protein AMXMBFR83_08820 [Phycisphaerae bacterium]